MPQPRQVLLILFLTTSISPMQNIQNDQHERFLALATKLVLPTLKSRAIFTIITHALDQLPENLNRLPLELPTEIANYRVHINNLLRMTLDYMDSPNSKAIAYPFMLWLIQHGADIDMQSKEIGITPLMVTAQAGDCDTALYLINQGAKINKQDNNNVTALMVSSTQKITELLLQHGADAHMRDTRQWNAIDYAELLHYSDIAELLKEHIA